MAEKHDPDKMASRADNPLAKQANQSARDTPNQNIPNNDHIAKPNSVGGISPNADGDHIAKPRGNNSPLNDKMATPTNSSAGGLPNNSPSGSPSNGTPVGGSNSNQPSKNGSGDSPSATGGNSASNGSGESPSSNGGNSTNNGSNSPSSNGGNSNTNGSNSSSNGDNSNSSDGNKPNDSGSDKSSDGESGGDKKDGDAIGHNSGPESGQGLSSGMSQPKGETGQAGNKSGPSDKSSNEKDDQKDDPKEQLKNAGNKAKMVTSLLGGHFLKALKVSRKTKKDDDTPQSKLKKVLLNPTTVLLGIIVLFLVVILGGGISTNNDDDECKTTTNTTTTTSGKWDWPTAAGEKGITSDFGPRDLAESPWHDGIDIQGGDKVPMKAVHDGTVIFVGNPNEKLGPGNDGFPLGLGKEVIVTKGSDGYEVIYQEYAMSGATAKVKEGDSVKVGQEIGTITTNHLHLGVTNKQDWVKAQAHWQSPQDTTWFLDPAKLIKEGQNASDSGEASVPDTTGEQDTGGKGDWTTKGTKAYNNAQSVWNAWKGLGFSGASISGIIGNIAKEGGFTIPDRAQGHFSDDEKEAGVTEGVEPDGGGAGLYQFTPYTKYAPKSDKKKWMDIMAQTEFAFKEAKAQGSAYANIDIKGYAQMTDLSETPQKWFAFYERGASYDPAKTTAANKAYSLFGGANVHFDEGLLAAGKVSGIANDAAAAADDCGNKTGESDPGAGKDLVDTAKKYIGWFPYSQDKRAEIADFNNVKKTDHADCSSFVWFVIAKTGGYKYPPDVGWYTKSMADDAKGAHKWLKAVDASDTQAGDIVIVNTGDGNASNGHTAIIEEPFKGDPTPSNKTKIINEGGAGDNVCEGEFGSSFSSLLGAGADVTFARPVKK